MKGEKNNMKFNSAITFVDKYHFTNSETGQLVRGTKVGLLVPVGKNDRRPNAIGCDTVIFNVAEEYYSRFKEAYEKGATVSVELGFQPTIVPGSREKCYKPYLKAIDGKEL